MRNFLIAINEAENKARSSSSITHENGHHEKLHDSLFVFFGNSSLRKLRADVKEPLSSPVIDGSFPFAVYCSRTFPRAQQTVV